jgi:putative membrane protein
MIPLAGDPFLEFPLDPSVYLGLVGLLLAYAWMSRGLELPRIRALYFGLGVAVIWLALETPLDTLGDEYLQAAHMVQHMLLVAFAPPLLLLGLSPEMAGRLVRIPGLRALTEWLPAQAIYAAVIILWHIPPVYDAALENDLLHIVEHLSFLAAGVLFWWPLILSTSAHARRPLSDPERLLYLFVGSLPMMAVALSLQFSRTLFYQAYVDAPRVLAGITPVLDQNIAGALMMLMDMSVLAVDGLVALYRWFAREQREDLARLDQLADEEFAHRDGAA